MAKQDRNEEVIVKTLLDISTNSDGIPGWNLKLVKQVVNEEQTEYVLLLNGLYYGDEVFADDSEAIHTVMQRIAAITPFAIKHASDYQEVDIMSIQFQNDAREVSDSEIEAIGIVIMMMHHGPITPVGAIANILKQEGILTSLNLHKTLNMLFGLIPDIDDLNALREWAEEGPF